jgi:hypothetical protein
MLPTRERHAQGPQVPDRAACLDRVAQNEKDAFLVMAKGTHAYFAACAKDQTARSYSTTAY